ncbi:MAG: response regulator [Desulfobacterales bacterium]|nr:response regulator [Desulfobacterales bacterium]
MHEFRVLVVDDERDFLETFVNRLRKRNLDVTGVESGEDAIALLDKQLFDVAILDVKMPGMDGVEALREMKRKRPLMEVIMLTGHASVESGIEGMKIGAFDYIMKPADIDDLMEKMRQAYQRKSAHEEKIRQAKVKELMGHPARIFEQIKEERK